MFWYNTTIELWIKFNVTNFCSCIHLLSDIQCSLFSYFQFIIIIIIITKPIPCINGSEISVVFRKKNSYLRILLYQLKNFIHRYSTPQNLSNHLFFSIFLISYLTRDIFHFFKIKYHNSLNLLNLINLYYSLN